jgi:hypothetical protein
MQGLRWFGGFSHSAGPLNPLDKWRQVMKKVEIVIKF